MSFEKRELEGTFDYDGEELEYSIEISVEGKHTTVNLVSVQSESMIDCMDHILQLVKPPKVTIDATREQIEDALYKSVSETFKQFRKEMDERYVKDSVKFKTPAPKPVKKVA